MGVEGAEKRFEGLSPPLFVLVEPLEKFLKRKPYGIVFDARSDELGNGGYYRVNGSRIRRRYHKIGIKPVRRTRHRVRETAYVRLRAHNKGGSKLRFAAERHINAARAYGRVESLARAFARAAGKRGKRLLQRFLGISFAHEFFGFRVELVEIGAYAAFDGYVLLLLHAVGIEESALDIHYRFVFIEHSEPRRVGHYGYRGGFEVLLRGKFRKASGVRLVHHYRHTLLRFAYRKLRRRKSFVFLANLVETDVESVRKLAYSHAYAARAEVVATLDHSRRLGIAEQSLELAFLRRIALLHLGAAGVDGVYVVRLARTGGSAAAVPSRIAAHKEHYVSLSGAQSYHVVGARAADNVSRFQPFRFVAVVIYFVHYTRCKPYLVAVATESRQSRFRQRALRELAGQSRRIALVGVARSRYAHRLIDVGAPRERVAYRAAQAGRRPAERLYLRGVVVRFVLEHYEPLLVYTVVVDVDDYGAGVDLLRSVEVVEIAFLAERFRGQSGDIHKTIVFVLPPRVLLIENFAVKLEALRDTRIVGNYFHVLYFGKEGGMSAMVAPVSVYHLELGERGVSFYFAEIVPDEFKVLQSHREAEARVIFFEFLLAHRDKAFYIHAHFAFLDGGAL